MTTSLDRFSLLPLVGVCLVMFAGIVATAQEPAADPLQVVGETPAELLQFIAKVKQVPPAGNDYASVVAHLLKVQEAVIAAADKIAADDPTEQELTTAVTEKITALLLLRRLEAPEAETRLKEYFDALLADKRPFIPPLAKIYRLATRVQNADVGNHAEVEQLLADVREQVRTVKPDARNLSVAFQAARVAEQAGLNGLAADSYREFAAAFAKSDDPQVVEKAKKLEGAARLLSLPGHAMEVKGKQLDGTPFDSSSYRGKTVLIDFWATWCGPCVAEMPNIKECYAKYHDRGFEVVGISLDDDKQRLDDFLKREPVPWPVLFSDDKEATGWNAPLAQYYGIMSLPRAILIGTDGNVVSIDAHGEELWSQLAAKIGPPTVAPPKEEPKEPAVEPKSDEK